MDDEVDDDDSRLLSFLFFVTAIVGSLGVFCDFLSRLKRLWMVVVADIVVIVKNEISAYICIYSIHMSQCVSPFLEAYV